MGVSIDVVKWRTLSGVGQVPELQFEVVQVAKV